ncbi:hypothetical protein [Nostoc sp. CHAB 5836]|uniref:hypothetical protein n=1 Tax=Nostoc sp. CHAB 5836 TaxID=2780404 RepID=UPI001E533EA2|nr:hypothetical protein [Nostoc sp. CHAB 5836]
MIKYSIFNYLFRVVFKDKTVIKSHIFSKSSYGEVQEVDNFICRVASVYKTADLPKEIYRKRLLNKIFKTKILTSCFLSIFLSIIQTALAGYQPPKDQKPPTGHSDSSGVRGGCKINSGRSLIILAPDTHIERINSFAWFVTDHQPVVRQFNLYGFDISDTNNLFFEANIHPGGDIHYIVKNEVILKNYF